jgi:hypothetical protein
MMMLWGFFLPVKEVVGRPMQRPGKFMVQLRVKFMVRYFQKLTSRQCQKIRLSVEMPNGIIYIWVRFTVRYGSDFL